MEQSERQKTIEKMIGTIVGKIKGVTGEQLELAKDFFIDDNRSIEEIKIALEEYAASIVQTNSKIPMNKVATPSQYELKISSPTKGINLGETQIDLITITELTSTNELIKFITECAQLNYSEEELKLLYKTRLSDAKRKVFEDYRATLIGTADIKKDPMISLRRKLKTLGLSDSNIEEIISLYIKGKKEEVINQLTTSLNLDLQTIMAQSFGKHSIDQHDVKCSSYEEFESLAKKIAEYDCVAITSGKYQYVMNRNQFDSYHVKRVLDFCKSHDIQVRYGSLLTSDMIETFLGQEKEEIKEKLRNYLSETINFIVQYNDENKLSDGMPVIRSVTLFDELINLKKDKSSQQGYYNIWNQLGLTTEDIVDVFAPVIGNKPAGIEYIYNEAFVETEEKRNAQLALAKEIINLAPELIDTFGTKMHINTDFSQETLERTFIDLQAFHINTGIGIAITEFDMHISNFTLNKMKQGKKTKEEIEEHVAITKTAQLKNVERIARKVGIEFTEISYGAITDSMDQNKKKYGEETLFGGLFGYTLMPQGIKEVVDYSPTYTVPSESLAIPSYNQDLFNMINDQPIEPEAKEVPDKKTDKILVKEMKSPRPDQEEDGGYVDFSQLLILTLMIVAILYILLM